MGSLPLRDLFQGVSVRAAGIAVGGLLLLCVYLYQGSPEILLRRLPAGVGGAHRAWWGRLYQYGAALLLFVCVPVAFIHWGFRESLDRWGIALGDVRFGAWFVALCLPVLVPVLYLTGRQKDFQSEYPLVRRAGERPALFLAWELTYLVYYVAWEFFFRGFLEFGLLGPLGPFWSTTYQTAASTLMHIGKPQGETMAAVLGGFVFGFVALETHSILYGLLVHWYLGALTDFFCLYHAGRIGRTAA